MRWPGRSRVPRTESRGRLSDIDIVVDLGPDRIDEFTAALGKDFYADASLIRESFAYGRAANLIHIPGAWKFDLFPLKTDEYSRTEFARRAWREVRPDGDQAMECAVASPEDTVLRKLECYRAGGERSERQWNDLLGVCRTVAQRLDLEHLRRWAPYLKIESLLEALLSESGLVTAHPANHND